MQVAVVTGAGRRLGRHIALSLAEKGFDIVVHYYSSKSGAENTVKKIKQLGNRAIAVKGDISNISDIHRIFQRIVKTFGRVDVLVNNAGIWEYGEADKMTLENWNRTLTINLTGSMLFTREVIPYMKKQGGGKIIIITSTAGQRGEAFHSHYAASKGALISYVKSLSTELAPYKILVNSVAPGWVDTEMNDEVFSDLNYKEQIRESIPLKKIATAEDIAGPVLFLASDLANHITGEILNVNGGSVLCG